ncbi:uncharacterized protein PADG_04971 [Paracoccidioides brasiliensis Pb18]|uniref:Uncharacterized protein n=1 Tax=Paracoccidioides brasiliensis (strain Pb18) TaxID=502780 RepID=C1GBH0_PARBD|nr:uncharacterized protein PADG_04971 [Paracoccidioides brasiliensis Pb18]EEH48892.2 hypothetical protein PADG_04971 [Paracoccidioides brasiliensis Pb18]ODH51429.1 hypothetical protein GX48_02485 [Paracoccidioides brasiliensis]
MSQFYVTSSRIGLADGHNIRVYAKKRLTMVCTIMLASIVAACGGLFIAWIALDV